MNNYQRLLVVLFIIIEILRGNIKSKKNDIYKLIHCKTIT